ncbi:MAG: RNA pseudouridine synthase [Gemmatimonadetes bacterium]|nr:RNA pseudouridine synthase [Gemmatimonadota bacterium]|tara:strand:- start:12336 stop:12989 length:654 start_codon:yes stop_codon:yes gene_type:complete
MDVIYEDNHLLVANKPAGQLAQGDSTGRPTLLDEAKAWIKQAYDKPGNVYLGLVHRLDRPASGVVVLARTSKAASRLSEEIRAGRPRKVYWALVEGLTEEGGACLDYLVRDEYTSRVGTESEGREARLRYVRKQHRDDTSGVEILLETGRHHQIRVQFAHRGHPVLGDRRYGSKRPFVDDAIALHAREMRILHPTRKEEMRFVAEPGPGWSDEWLNS